MLLAGTAKATRMFPADTTAVFHMGGGQEQETEGSPPTGACNFLLVVCVCKLQWQWRSAAALVIPSLPCPLPLNS